MRTEFKQCIQIPVQASEKNHVFALSHAGGFNAQLTQKKKRKRKERAMIDDN